VERGILLHGLFLFLLPVLVAWLGVSVPGAVALVLLALLWRWGISLNSIATAPRGPELELETISASHFVEKVRWCMDRLGVNYVEKPVGGALGAFFLGRTVPLLKFRSGAVRSSIGNSPEILRYLYGRYGAERGEQAEFLRPTPERLDLESRIDRCGTNLQVWVYYHVLDDRELTLHAWGANSPALPAWQRFILRPLYPLLRFLMRRAFRITTRHHAKAVQHLTGMLADVEGSLADGRQSILGGDEINYSDIAFAAIMGLWVMPSAFGGGRADAVRIGFDRCPAAMQAEIADWKKNYPLVTAFVERLYAEQRNLPPGNA
jgi:glutathione S-transferase